MAPPPTSLLDHPIARVAALGVFVLALASLVAIHRDDLFPPAAEVSAPTPYEQCVAARTAEVAGMREEGLVTEAQAELFATRAEALCGSQHSK